MIYLWKGTQIAQYVLPNFFLCISGLRDPEQPFDEQTSVFYESATFAQKANETAAFLQALPPYLDGRPVTLQNMVSCHASSFPPI
jgi:hypothetical protein